MIKGPREGQSLWQTGMMEGTEIRRFGQVDLIRGEHRKTPWIITDVGGIYYHDPAPSLQKTQKIQPPRPSIDGCHAFGQSTEHQLLHYAWTYTVVLAKRVSQPDDSEPFVIHHYIIPGQSYFSLDKLYL